MNAICKQIFSEYRYRFQFIWPKNKIDTLVEKEKNRVTDTLYGNSQSALIIHPLKLTECFGDLFIKNE